MTKTEESFMIAYKNIARLRKHMMQGHDAETYEETLQSGIKHLSKIQNYLKNLHREEKPIRFFRIRNPLVVKADRIDTSKLYPMWEISAQDGKVQEILECYNQNLMPDPVICHNIKDDSTYQVCIGIHRLKAAQLKNAPWVPCIVNCIAGQTHIPGGQTLKTSHNVAEKFQFLINSSLSCIRPVENNFGARGDKYGVFANTNMAIYLGQRLFTIGDEEE